jgi:hypothetical protein
MAAAPAVAPAAAIHDRIARSNVADGSSAFYIVAKARADSLAIFGLTFAIPFKTSHPLIFGM